MLSHIRKSIERAVIDALDELICPDRMQFGFQRAINTLQAAIDVAAVLNEAVQHLFAILDLTKAYDRVVRARLIEKLKSMDITQDLVNQIVVFLVPLVVQTAGDVTRATAIITTGLAQGGSASPALFRIFIDDLAGDLRQAQGKNREAVGDSLEDPAKLVADDVVVIAKSEEGLQTLLDTCTNWAARNHLEWKPQKCSVVVKWVGALRRCTFWLADQPIPLKRKTRYLGVMFGSDGFSKEAGRDLTNKCLQVCQAITSQPFFDAGLPTSTVLALYRANVRSILTYGLALTRDTGEMERLDRKLLNLYFKPLCFLGRELPDKLIDRLCLRMRLPSLKMEIENAARKRTGKLERASMQAVNSKAKTHAKDSLTAIHKLHPSTPLRSQGQGKRMSERKWLVRKFKEWNEQLAPAKKESRTVDKVTRERLHQDILDSHELSVEQKRSVYRYFVYRFPLYIKMSKEEDTEMKFLMKQDLNREERREVIRRLKQIHARDTQAQIDEEAAKSLLELHEKLQAREIAEAQ